MFLEWAISMSSFTWILFFHSWIWSSPNFKELPCSALVKASRKRWFHRPWRKSFESLWWDSFYFQVIILREISSSQSWTLRKANHFMSLPSSLKLVSANLSFSLCWSWFLQTFPVLFHSEDWIIVETPERKNQWVAHWSPQSAPNSNIPVGENIAWKHPSLVRN